MALKRREPQSTKKSFSLVAFVPLWFKAFMLFATPSFEVVAKGRITLLTAIFAKAGIRFSEHSRLRGW